jgi:hypothetical protein
MDPLPQPAQEQNEATANASGCASACSSAPPSPRRHFAFDEQDFIAALPNDSISIIFSFLDARHRRGLACANRYLNSLSRPFVVRDLVTVRDYRGAKAVAAAGNPMSALRFHHAVDPEMIALCLERHAASIERLELCPKHPRTSAALEKIEMPHLTWLVYLLDPIPSEKPSQKEWGRRCLANVKASSAAFSHRLTLCKLCCWLPSSFGGTPFVSDLSQRTQSVSNLSLYETAAEDGDGEMPLEVPATWPALAQLDFPIQIHYDALVKTIVSGRLQKTQVALPALESLALNAPNMSPHTTAALGALLSTPTQDNADLSVHSITVRTLKEIIDFASPLCCGHANFGLYSSPLELASIKWFCEFRQYAQLRNCECPRCHFELFSLLDRTSATATSFSCCKMGQSLVPMVLSRLPSLKVAIFQLFSDGTSFQRSSAAHLAPTCRLKRLVLNGCDADTCRGVLLSPCCRSLERLFVRDVDSEALADVFSQVEFYGTLEHLDVVFPARPPSLRSSMVSSLMAMMGSRFSSLLSCHISRDGSKNDRMDFGVEIPESLWYSV